MNIEKCKRCGGTFYTRHGLDGDETSCMNCGHNPTYVVPPDIRAEVEASLGRKTVRTNNPRFNVREDWSLSP